MAFIVAGKIKRYTDENGRVCSLCNTYKLWKEYSPHKNSPYGHYSQCKECAAIMTRAHKYNLTYEQVKEMIKQTTCDICGKEETAITSFSGNVKALAIDHCHETGQIRGMLCSRCNVAMGKLNDSIPLIKKCIDYLENNLDLTPPKRRESNGNKDCELWRLYGISLDMYNEILAQQNNACAICGIIPNYGKSLGVDHNHNSGNIRGLLCVNCNVAIGNFKDSPHIMQSAIDYLRAFS